jgi:acyl-[acyl-carrier-protein]-phospholipid O-acyltransferase/long-chain-fatty-acid--[acyl-carrier-protein] ligase
METLRTQNHSSGNYSRLLGNGGFEAFLWTQFLGAFNDNVYKMIVSMLAVEIAANRQLGALYLSISLAVFNLPYLLFAGYAGQLADRFSKTRVLQVTKALEIATMLLGLSALLMNRIELLLGVLFLLATQANFFSPAKYGILPEMMSEAEITAGNGLVEFSTLAAIVLGTSFGGFLISIWKHSPWNLGGTLLGIAVVGSLCSLGITRVPASGSSAAFHWNPFHEVWIGFGRLRESRALALTVTGLSYFWFLGALFTSAILLLGNEILHAPELQVSMLAAALALGIGLGSIAAGWISRTHIELGLVPLGSLLLGVFSVFLGFRHSYAWTASGLVAMGFAGGLFFVPLNAFLQERAGNQEKGRLLATTNFFNTAAMLFASAVLWILHDKLHWPATTIIGALGVLTLLATVYVVSVVPADVLRLILFGLSRSYFRIRVVGADRIPANGAAILISNHVSYGDSLLIGGCTHRFVRFLMWKPIFDLKFAKPFFQILQAIPIDPHSPKETVRALRQACNELKSGELVCIFPEGGLTRTGHVQTFQRGVERLMECSPETPVIPIYLDGLWGHPLAPNGKRSVRDWLRSWRREVTVMIGEPLHGKMAAWDLRQRVLELGSEAVEFRKKADCTLSHGLVRAARQNWFRPAIADSTNKRLKFGETLTAAVLVKDWLNKEHAGERNIGLLLPTSVGGALANFGVTLAGRAAVNLNFTAGEQNCRAAIELCGIRTVLTSRKFLEKANLPVWSEMVYLEDLLTRFTPGAKLRAMLAARFAPIDKIVGSVGPDDVATIPFSSGSTGVPKGVELTHWNIVSNMEAAASVFPIDSSHCMLGVLPLFHAFGYTFALWFPIVHQFRAAYHPNPTDAKSIGELAEEHRPTFFLATPTFCLNYIRKCTPEQFSSLKYILVGAEALKASVAEAFRKKFGVGLLAGYGCTELGPSVAANAPDFANGSVTQEATREGSVGRPAPGMSVRIVDPESFEPVPQGQQGMVLVKSPSRMKGYYRAPEKTRQVLREGYYITGDLGHLDQDGFLYITDRLARFSKIAGEMVPHLKIEDAASGLLETSPSFVTGVADERRGERLVMLYTSPEITPAQIVEHLNGAGLPALWIPKRENIYLVDEIPTLGTGKVDLAKARAMVLEKAAPVGAGVES